MGLSAVAIARVAGMVISAGSAAYSAKTQRKTGKESTHEKHKAAAEAQEEKKRLARLSKEKSPTQRLLGGRPSLG